MQQHSCHRTHCTYRFFHSGSEQTCIDKGKLSDNIVPHNVSTNRPSIQPARIVTTRNPSNNSGTTNRSTKRPSNEAQSRFASSKQSALALLPSGVVSRKPSGSKVATTYLPSVQPSRIVTTRKPSYKRDNA